jgi:hypothetical protein
MSELSYKDAVGTLDELLHMRDCWGGGLMSELSYKDAGEA